MESGLGVWHMPLGSSRSTARVVSRGNGDPVFLAAGREANGEFRCTDCGYGVIVRSILPSCPMCRGQVWEGPTGSRYSY